MAEDGGVGSNVMLNRVRETTARSTCGGSRIRACCDDGTFKNACGSSLTPLIASTGAGVLPSATLACLDGAV